MFKHSRVFHVQAYQLADALHDHFTCPFSHKETSKNYIPRNECPRIENLTDIAYKLLEMADGIDFRPFTSVTVNGETFEQPPLDL